MDTKFKTIYRDLANEAEKLAPNLKAIERFEIIFFFPLLQGAEIFFLLTSSIMIYVDN